MGEFKTNQDIGMGAMGQLGDFAWLDLDGDGMQDEGEPYTRPCYTHVSVW